MIGTLIALGCIFAAVALILGLIFMPRTVAMLFGIHIAIPYISQLAIIVGKSNSALIGLIALLILYALSIILAKDIGNIIKRFSKNKYFLSRKLFFCRYNLTERIK